MIIKGKPHEIAAKHGLKCAYRCYNGNVNGAICFWRNDSDIPTTFAVIAESGEGETWEQVFELIGGEWPIPIPPRPDRGSKERRQKMSEIWTAKEQIIEEDKEFIVFEIKDEQTGTTREERKYKDALPLMFVLGGYPSQVGLLMTTQELPWHFRKVNDQIYLDGPSIGVEGYHPIDD